MIICDGNVLSIYVTPILELAQHPFNTISRGILVEPTFIVTAFSTDEI